MKKIFKKNEDFTLTCVMHYWSYVDIWGGVGPNKTKITVDGFLLSLLNPA